MNRIAPKNILGIVGGMGPLASAEFLKTIYEYSLKENEQDSPIIMMYSDPTFPDRTEAFLSGHCDNLLESLINALHRLCEFGASRMVVCCVTIHYLLPKLPSTLRKQIISLLDVTLAGVMQAQRKSLLICSNGTRKLEIFQNHYQWKFAKDYIVLPDDGDQDKIHHELIYQALKVNNNISELIQFFESLLTKYQVNSFIAGCTEIHLLAKHLISFYGSQQGYNCVDPLAIIAKELAEKYKGVIKW